MADDKLNLKMLKDKRPANSIGALTRALILVENQTMEGSSELAKAFLINNELRKTGFVIRRVEDLDVRTAEAKAQAA